MLSRRDFLKKSALGLAAIAASPITGKNLGGLFSEEEYKSKRPELNKRRFISKSIEEVISEVSRKIKNPKLKWMFENCFPNTLDTTVFYSVENNEPDTFVITGDIHAMWLRDSSAQVWPYLPFVKKDDALRRMIVGVIRRQIKSVLIDPYANAFNEKPDPKGHWMSDGTKMNPNVYERKWEIDSLCYTIRLAHRYWKETKDASVFDAEWEKAASLILKTFKQQQRKNDNLGPYSFLRVTDRQLDTLCNKGYGRPVTGNGLIVSSFRPSDDATTFGYLIPSNMFAVRSLHQMSEILRKIRRNSALASEAELLAKEVDDAIKRYGIVEHPLHGKIFAYEIDGFGGRAIMDDANVPSLLALPYLDCIDINNRIYQNTRKVVLSKGNPYFFKGSAGEGIGGPHVGLNMIWPMSIIMRAMTSNDEKEIIMCVKMLMNTDANTGFMHESFQKDDPKNFTRTWFAWANTLFGELILKLDKMNLLSKL